MIKRISLSVLIVFLGIIVSGWYIFANKKTETFIENTPNIATSTKIVDLNAIQLNTSDWKTYNYEKGGFSFKYPKDWKVDDTSFDNGEMGWVDELRIHPISVSIEGHKYPRDYKEGEYEGVVLYPTDTQTTYEFLNCFEYCLSKVKIQKENVNGNELSIVSGEELDIAGKVFLTHQNKTFEFIISDIAFDEDTQLSVFKGEAFNVTIGIIRSLTFK